MASAKDEVSMVLGDSGLSVGTISTLMRLEARGSLEM